MKVKFEIKHWMTGALLFEFECETLKEAVCEAVKRGAYLGGANLEGAYLVGANLRGAKGITPQTLQILGTRHALIVRDYGRIEIGCHSKTLAQWEKHYTKIGEAEGYTAEQIEEYREHIASCRKFMERYKLLEKPKEQAVAV